MEINSLAQRLRDPDPRIRVETLRILAMVEETRALSAVRWVFQNDPEPGVREVANWTGQVLWQAHQRGHSTQRAIEETYQRALPGDLRALFAQTAELDAVPGGDLPAAEAASAPAVEIVPPEENLPEVALPDVRRTTQLAPAVPRPADVPPEALPTHLDDLLDDGLTDLFAE